MIPGRCCPRAANGHAAAPPIMLRRSLRRRLLGGNADYRSGIESVLGSGPRRSSAMARNSALYSLRLVREAFRIEATTF